MLKEYRGKRPAGHSHSEDTITFEPESPGQRVEPRLSQLPGDRYWKGKPKGEADRNWWHATHHRETLKQNFTLTAQREFDDVKDTCRLFSLGLQSRANRCGRIAVERKRISRRSGSRILIETSITYIVIFVDLETMTGFSFRDCHCHDNHQLLVFVSWSGNPSSQTNR
jgi:hypothetical protein